MNISIRLRLYYYLHEFELAIEESHKINNESIYSYEAFFIRIISSINLGKYDLAVSNLENFIINHEDDYFGYSILAYAHFKQGNEQKSVECYKEAIKLDNRFNDDIDSLESIFYGLEGIKEIYKKILVLI